MAFRTLVISDLSGGRNGADSPVSALFPDNQCVEAANIDFRLGGLGRKRGGSYDVLPNTTSVPFANDMYSLIRHVPGGDETLGEIWGVSNTLAPTEFGYLAPGTAWAIPSAGQNVQSRPQDVNGVSFNGKLFLFFDSATDRLKVWDSVTTTVRLVGLSASAAPTVANTGAGAYAATLRFYRSRFVQMNGAITVRVAEPSAAVSFTPSGGGTAARVTRPALVNEGETHWRLEASIDNVNYYIIATTAIASTYDDSAAIATYANNELTELTGTYTLLPSAKFGVTDGNRLVMAGNWENGKGSRVTWTPVLGSLNRGDDERLFQTATLVPYIDLDEKNGGDVTGIGQINGVIYIFKYHQVWRLSPTGDLGTPYLARRLSGNVGTVSHKSIALGEDAVGNPALYFMSHNGPYRVSASGIEYIGRDIEDITFTINGKPNINTTATKVVAHSVFYENAGQWHLWVATGTANSPNEWLILDVSKLSRRDEYGARGGWTRNSGENCTALCSCMGNYALGATAALRPWVGIPGAPSANIAILDRDDIYTDRGTAFQTQLVTKHLGDPSRFGQLIQAREALILISTNSAGFTDAVQSLYYYGDFGFGFIPPASLITVNGALADLKQVKKFDDATVADVVVLQVYLLDVLPALNRCQIDILRVLIDDGGEA